MVFFCPPKHIQSTSFKMFSVHIYVQRKPRRKEHSFCIIIILNQKQKNGDIVFCIHSNRIRTQYWTKMITFAKGSFNFKYWLLQQQQVNISTKKRTAVPWILLKYVQKNKCKTKKIINFISEALLCLGPNKAELALI